MHNTLSLVLFSSLVVAHWPSWSTGPWRNSGLQVQTSSGRVQGKTDPALPHVRQFLGIPYAQPPVNDLRFAAPEPLSQPDVEIDATSLPPSCLQYLNTEGSSVYINDVLEFNLQGLNRTGSISEDCLTLSVWAPSQAKNGKWQRDKKSKGLPVLIFIYGGGFSTGGQDVPYQIPAQWVERSQEHIVVLFNYRVNIFGHPNAVGLDDQNPGLLDQRAAVKWVQENVVAFGGDPARTVLWGQSAGSISVDYYNFAYPSDPIVTGLIMDSGTAQSPVTTADTAQTNFTFVADNVGCSDFGGDAAGRLACMRNVDANAIEDFVAQYQISGQTPAIRFRPVIDEKTVFSNYTEQAIRGGQAKIPAIIGTNAQDGVPFAPYNPDGPDPALAEQALLSTFFCPSTQTTRLRQQTGLQTYKYEYFGNFSNVSPRPWLGAFHSAELPMLFGTHPNYIGPSTGLEYDTSHAMQDAWLAFAKDPEAGLGEQDWNVYEELGESDVRGFGDGVAAKDVSVAALEAKCNGAAPAA